MPSNDDVVIECTKLTFIYKYCKWASRSDTYFTNNVIEALKFLYFNSTSSSPSLILDPQLKNSQLAKISPTPELCKQIRSIIESFFPYVPSSPSLDTIENRGVFDVNLKVTVGSRVIVVGKNGSGKSTLLSILAGGKMIPEHSVKVFGKPSFHDTTLSERVMYLGQWWSDDYTMDITVAELLDPSFQHCTRMDSESSRIPGISKVEEFIERLIKFSTCLGVTLSWRVSELSSGERRRAQLLCLLVNRREIYILDEATSDLDVPSREALLKLLKEEGEKYKCTILYATHILEGLENWATHILYMRKGRIHTYNSLETLNEYRCLAEDGNVKNPLFHLVREWILNE